MAGAFRSSVRFLVSGTSTWTAELLRLASSRVGDDECSVVLSQDVLDFLLRGLIDDFKRYTQHYKTYIKKNHSKYLIIFDEKSSFSQMLIYRHFYRNRTALPAVSSFKLFFLNYNYLSSYLMEIRQVLFSDADISSLLEKSDGSSSSFIITNKFVTLHL